MASYARTNGGISMKRRQIDIARIRKSHMEDSLISMNRVGIKEARAKRRRYSESIEHKRYKEVKVLKFDGLFKDYIRDVEQCTGRKISNEQLRLLKESVDKNRFVRLTPKQSHAHRGKFNKAKPEMIEQWEEHYGEKWPTYREPVYSRKGKMVRMKGARYDVHEMIFNSWNSPHFWWNCHPAKYPTEHQSAIHRKGGVADRIFG